MLMAWLRHWCKCFEVWSIQQRGRGDNGMETSALYRETLPVIASSVVAWLGVGFLMLERYKMLSLRRRVVATPVESCAAILNALPDMIFLVDEDGTYLDCYTKGVRDNYPARDQFLGKNMRD